MTEENKSVKNFPNLLPKLRFKGFEGSWTSIKIENIAPLQRGFDLPSQNIVNGNIPIVYSNGILKFHNESKCTAPGLITGRSGTIGKFTFLEEGAYWPHNTSLWVTNFFDNDPKFIYYLYHTINIENFSTGSGVPTLNRNNVHNQICNIPPVNEQKKISSFFTSIDNRISTQKKIIEQLETLIKGVGYKLFNKKIRFKNTDLSEFPCWESKKGNEVFSNISNKNHNSELPILAITQEHGAIPRDFIDFQISVTDKSVESYKIVEKGDFIISLRSFQGGIEYSEYNGICSPAYIILRNKTEVNSYFYKYYFKSESYIKQLNKKLEGIRDGKMISYAYFSDINLPLPSLNEQNKITNFLSSIQGKIEMEKQILEKLKLQKKFLLANLFV
ncbi:type I restriction enzyme S subunit [Chryseobacterium sediminis]|uniref:Type I restriction enzyme S subunit n=1 Tax=Chryseobacterium sediminis TaxID=1679494 RepID=A0ABR6PZH4_9FLAO|nr:restriction endonuclease subunit S [Chryseobacterium sediminis]MBB6331116.1 type I restriction enzyme S subunit [Chryseobacterium sediminis]